jgi:glutathione S-transferase
MAHRLKLVSFDVCPYVERSRIVLLEKGVPHELAFIDLADKPAWFLAISPMGRVPVLLVDDRPIFESMIINELLEELHPRPPLFPADPLARAEARAWIVFANDVLFPGSAAAMTALAGGYAGDALARPLGVVRDALAKLEPQVARAGGPHFLGEAFTLVDAAYAPFFRRWREAEGWGGAEARLLAGFPAVSAWADALLRRPSVVQAAPAELGKRSRQLFAARAAKAKAAAAG